MNKIKTYKDAIKLLKSAGEDIDICEETNGEDGLPCIDVHINDFYGITKDGDEDYRDLDNPELVNEIIDTIKQSCNYIKGRIYTMYMFDDFYMTISWDSDDI